MADVSCYCEVGQCLDKFTGLFDVHGISLAPYPRIREWLAECEKIPGYERCHEVLKGLGPKIKGKAVKLQAKL